MSWLIRVEYHSRPLSFGKSLGTRCIKMERHIMLLWLVKIPNGQKLGACFWVLFGKMFSDASIPWQCKAITHIESISLEIHIFYSNCAKFWLSIINVLQKFKINKNKCEAKLYDISESMQPSRESPSNNFAGVKSQSQESKFLIH